MGWGEGGRMGPVRQTRDLPRLNPIIGIRFLPADEGWMGRRRCSGWGEWGEKKRLRRNPRRRVSSSSLQWLFAESSDDVRVLGRENPSYGGSRYPTMGVLLPYILGPVLKYH